MSKFKTIKTKDIQIDFISRASYEYIKKTGWIFIGNMIIDEYIKKYFIKIAE